MGQEFSSVTLVKTMQLFPLRTVLMPVTSDNVTQHVKVGHFSRSLIMVIFIFGLKRIRLIYFAPIKVSMMM